MIELEKEKEGKSYISYYSLTFLKIEESSVLSKSRIATRMTSERLGYRFILTNSSIPVRYASGI